MADPFSIAAGAVAISETGIRLANTIYDACRAEKQLQPLADHVRLTSTVLKQIESHLQDEASTKHFKKELYDETQRALERCTQAFEALDQCIQSLVKHDGKGGRRLSAAARLTWNWRRKDIAAQEAHLERSHTALSRLLTVMIFVSSSRSAQNTQELKIDIQKAIAAEAQAEKRVNQPTLVHDAGTGDAAEVTAATKGATEGIQDQISERRNLQTWSLPSPSDESLPATSSPIVNSDISAVLSPSDTTLAVPAGGFYPSLPPSRAQMVWSQIPHREDSYGDHLRDYLLDCNEAISELAVTARRALTMWRSTRRYDRGCLQVGGLQKLQVAVEKVNAYELTLPVPLSGVRKEVPGGQMRVSRQSSPPHPDLLPDHAEHFKMNFDFNAMQSAWPVGAQQRHGDTGDGLSGALQEADFADVDDLLREWTTLDPRSVLDEYSRGHKRRKY